MGKTLRGGSWAEPILFHCPTLGLISTVLPPGPSASVGVVTKPGVVSGAKIFAVGRRGHWSDMSPATAVGQPTGRSGCITSAAEAPPGRAAVLRRRTNPPSLVWLVALWFVSRRPLRDSPRTPRAVSASLGGCGPDWRTSLRLLKGVGGGDLQHQLARVRALLALAGCGPRTEEPQRPVGTRSPLGPLYRRRWEWRAWVPECTHQARRRELHAEGKEDGR